MKRTEINVQPLTREHIQIKTYKRFLSFFLFRISCVSLAFSSSYSFHFQQRSRRDFSFLLAFASLRSFPTLLAFQQSRLQQRQRLLSSCARSWSSPMKDKKKEEEKRKKKEEEQQPETRKKERLVKERLFLSFFLFSFLSLSRELQLENKKWACCIFLYVCLASSSHSKNLSDDERYKDTRTNTHIQQQQPVRQINRREKDRQMKDR